MRQGQRQTVRKEPDTQAESPWLPLTRIGPYGGTEGDVHIELSNALLRQRLAMSREALLELIAASLCGPTSSSILIREYLADRGFLAGNGLDDATREGIQRWESHNWVPSLDLYLWSRRWHFDDNGADFEEARDAALRRFLQEEGEPPVRFAEGSSRLDSPGDLPTDSVGDVLWRRSSGYSTTARCIPQAVLSSILHHGFAPFRMPPTPESDDIYGYLVGLDRVYDVYLAVFDVEGLTPGIYLYDIRNEKYQLLRAGIFRDSVQASLIGQRAPLTSGCVLLLTTDFRRIQWVYRHDRVIRNTYINSGRIMQSLILVATSFKLLTSITPAVNDSVALDLLGLDGKESQVLYTLCLS